MADTRDRDDLQIPVSQVMSTPVLSAGRDATVAEAAREMRARRVGCVVVLGEEPGGIAGVFTERDMVMRVVGAGRDPARTPLGDVMTTEVATVDADLPVAKASELVNTRGFRHVPVVAGGRLVGVISMRDLFRLRLRRMELLLDQEVRALHEAQALLGLDEQSRVSALLGVNERLQQLALTDELTGLYNHRYFVQRLSQEAARADRLAAPLSLLFADLDHFKKVNDDHGHQAGDRVLAQVATVLRHAVEGTSVVARLRKSDVVTRYGGEEFAILLLDARAAGARAVAERIRLAIEEQAVPLPGGAEVRVTASLGVACLPDDASSAEALVRAADEALYRAKREGRNRVECAPGPGR